MKKYQLTCLLIASVALGGCTSLDFKEIPGTYAAEGFVETKDTIWLKADGNFERVIYSSKNSNKWAMHGKWEYGSHSSLELNSFFINHDRDIAAFPELINDTIGGYRTLIERNGGEIQFCLGPFEGQHCFRKIDDSQ